jgi:hypothetical protein
MFEKFFVKFEKSDMNDVNVDGNEPGEAPAEFTYRVIAYDDNNGSGIVKVFPFGMFAGNEIECFESPDGAEAAKAQAREKMKIWHPDFVYRELPYSVI